MSVSLYIYYRIDGNFPSFECSSRKIMAQIASEMQIKGRLLQRRDDAHTWMEIYEPVTDLAALEQALSRAVATDASWLGVARHAECFTEI
ncbi:DUF4936 family protein [Vogesella sp. DC21W]|uniref:DUF4936 family protein n=1 Tax=Vogesella aquatica TaxID=2984206 RepID=A0ABT5J0J4_9NEIS|nr:DUF4936 family protein [Vogesella aquatica]MDC7718347.1 DUF4936 family protein [Vogesella aquatica]